MSDYDGMSDIEQESESWKGQPRKKQSVARRTFKKMAWHVAARSAPVYQPLHDAQMAWRGVRRVHWRLKLEDFPSGTPCLRVAFLSDLHYGPTVGRLAPLQAWRAVRAADPDLIVLGGDYLYSDRRGLKDLQRELARTQAPLGLCAVWGNHDFAFEKDLRRIFAHSGVRVLVNEAFELPAPRRGVYIVGVDDVGYGRPQPEKALAQVPEGACKILVTHSPDLYEIFPGNECSLTLCGDTHGGQICLPNGTPILMGHSIGRHYLGGMYRPNGKYLWVSRGVGTVSLPIRLFAPPDVAIFDLS